MKPAAFEYHVPTTGAEAVGLLAELGDEAKLLAGGQSLVPMLALRMAVFDHLVDLRRVDELRGIEIRDESVWIGAGTTHAAVGRSDQLRRAIPLLHRATPLIGHFQIRNRGTLGGAIAHADSAGEYPVVASTLDAEIHLLSPRGQRTLAAADFFTGLWTTAMEPDELLTGVTFPIWRGRTGFAIEEFARRAGDFAMAGASVAVRLDGSSRVEQVAVGLFGLAPTPIRAHTVESAVIGRPVADIDAAELGRSATDGLSAVPADMHGSADYRRRVGAVMVARAWARAVEEASND